ncbi:hypothetical protein LCGC14_1940850 [marine sediment metagenome]|uniref:Uncharacterized protein n=1 Tax=marine sediment metagenome TaxID=412755 RepID=A0A0F9FKC5_9ZZZZ
MNARFEVQPNTGSHVLVPSTPEDCNHDWPVSSGWGVLLGVSRCHKCKVVAREEHFTGETP